MFKIGVRNGSAFHSLRADRCFLRRCNFCNGHNRQAHLTSTRCDDLATTINPAKDRPGGGLCILEIGDQAVNIAAGKKDVKCGRQFSTYKATVKAEAIAHHRRILASCITNAIGPTVAIEALRELGTGGV
jgi:hypothetical protein